jgi:hypothetical protein
MMKGKLPEDAEMSDTRRERLANFLDLHESVHGFLDLIFRGVEESKGDCLLKSNVVEYFKTTIRTENRKDYRTVNALLKGIYSLLYVYVLMVDVLPSFTAHKWIDLPEYDDDFIGDVIAKYNVEPASVVKVHYLANLTLLLRDLIDMTYNITDISEEDRVLRLSAVDLVFPSSFTSTPDDGAIECLIELRTQIFISHFLEMVNGAYFQEWEIENSLQNIFKLELEEDDHEDASFAKAPPRCNHTYPDSSCGV